jgi:hypothetical protein
MKLSVLLAAVSLFATPAFAQSGASPIDGDWIGKGSFQMGGDVLACTEIKMKFVGTAAIFGVRDASFACESFKQAFPMNDDFEVRPNDDIYYKGAKIGAVTGTGLSVLVPGKDAVGTEFTLRREGDFLYYNEVSRAPGQPPVFGMVAIMQKDPNTAAPQH